MELKCKINGKEYNITQGVTFSEEYNETLDSGTIIISQVKKIEDIEPYDDVFIYDNEFDGYGNKKIDYKNYTFKDELKKHKAIEFIDKGDDKIEVKVNIPNDFMDAIFKYREIRKSITFKAYQRDDNQGFSEYHNFECDIIEKNGDYYFCVEELDYEGKLVFSQKNNWWNIEIANNNSLIINGYNYVETDSFNVDYERDFSEIEEFYDGQPLVFNKLGNKTVDVVCQMQDSIVQALTNNEYIVQTKKLDFDKFIKLNFFFVHNLIIAVFNMVISHQMKHAMNNKFFKFLFRSNTKFLCLFSEPFNAKSHIAKVNKPSFLL